MSTTTAGGRLAVGTPGSGAESVGPVEWPPWQHRCVVVTGETSRRAAISAVDLLKAAVSWRSKGTSRDEDDDGDEVTAAARVSGLGSCLTRDGVLRKASATGS